MPQSTVVQIVPRRTTVPDGVGDYATLLAEALDAEVRVSSVFLQGTPAHTAQPRNDRWLTVPVRRRSAEILRADLSALIMAHRPVAVVAHISPYGYQTHGLPIWLSAGLNSWKRQGTSFPLIM